MKFFNAFLVAIFLLVQVPVSEASTVEKELGLQLTAIAEYIQYNFSVEKAILDTGKMREIIHDGADWIVAVQEEDGHFGYEYEPYEDNYLNDDNMVRQAGTLFALSEVYLHQTDKDPEIAKTIEKSIDYFVEMSGESESEDGNFWCIKNSARSSRCDLGSVSLALIGILNFVKVEPEKRADYANKVEKYISYIKAAKFPDAGFSNKYFLGDGFSKNESPFYNGEAMLALVNYYHYQPDEEVKMMLEEVFAYLSAKEDYETPLYLWIMAALKDMQKLWPNDSYVRYASDFTAWRLDRSIRLHNMTRNYCAPVEGFTSAYSVLEENETDAYLERLGDEIEFWLSKTAWLQLDESSPYRVVEIDDKLQIVRFLDSTFAHGGFLTGEKVLTQRIDFTQHCVSSYLQKLVDIDGEEL